MTDREHSASAVTPDFVNPQAVLDNDSLTDRRKLEILEGWSADLIELQVAETENMPGPGPDTGTSAKRLAEVKQAIATIRGESSD